jgi:CheY-like chemotaxis protein
MARTKEEILIVDDSLSIRTSMSLVLNEMGYRVRTAEDGFDALRQVRQLMPDILLSDLNMPGMSGFELLSVFRQRFPTVQTIAMSGAFSHGEVPSGVVADAFFPKGQGIEALMQTIAILAQTRRRAPRPWCSVSPFIVERSAYGSFQEACITISCPECLRTFTPPFAGDGGRLIDTHCFHCGFSIQYAIVQQSNQTNLQASQYKLGASVRSQMRLASAIESDKKEIDLCATLPKRICWSKRVSNFPMA